CARCHDHKFDPIPSTDYYALYGIFASTRYSFAGTEIYRHSKDYIALNGEEDAKQLHEYEYKLADLDDKLEVLLREKLVVSSRLKAEKDLAEKMAKERQANGGRPASQPAGTSPPPHL